MKDLEKRFVKTIARLMVFAFIMAGINLACTSMVLAKMGNGEVKNVIIMISDGCGFNHIDAASYYQYGKAGVQVYEHFPTARAMSTYSAARLGLDDPLADPLVYNPLLGYDPAKAWNDFNYVKDGATDSAAAATAMSTGFKTYDAAIGGVGTWVDPPPTMPPTLPTKPSDFTKRTHILERAEELGKATGVVTSVQISHATPAGFVAHNWNRNNYAEIAKEMIYDSDVDVIMGCGNPWFDKDGLSVTTPPSSAFNYVGGKSTWNALVGGTACSDVNGDGVPDYCWKLIQTRTEFKNLADGPTPERVIGVAQVANTLQQERTTANPIQTVPALEEMTKAALNVLDNNAKGFFLMIEGGAIDGAAHKGQSGRVIEEQIDFNHSVEAVVDWVEKNSNWGETLVIVTGDHETGYLLGPNSGPGSDPMWQPIVNNGKGMLPGMDWYNWLEPSSPPGGGVQPPPMTWHTNSLVPFFAKGDVARFFKDSADKYDPVRGRYLDNTEIAKVIFKLWE